MRSVRYILAVSAGIFLFLFPAYADDPLSVIQRAIEENQRIVSRARPFPEQGELLRDLNTMRKQVVKPVEGIKGAVVFLESTQGLSALEQRDALKAFLRIVSSEYQRLMEDEMRMKSSLNKTPRHDGAYPSKVAKLQANHESLARLKAQLDVLEEASRSGAKSAIAIGEVRASRLIGEKGVQSLIDFAKKESFKKIPRPQGSVVVVGGASRILQVAGKIGAVADVVGAKQKWDDMKVPYRNKCLEAWGVWNAQAEKIKTDLQAVEMSISGLKISLDSPYAEKDKSFWNMISKELENAFNKRARLRTDQENLDSQKPPCDALTGTPIA